MLIIYEFLETLCDISCQFIDVGTTFKGYID